MSKLFKIRKGGIEKSTEDLVRKLQEELAKKEVSLSELEKRIKELEAENDALQERIKKETIYPLINNSFLRALLNYLLELYEESKKNYYRGIAGAKAETIVFAHKDADGVCSTALIEKLYKNAEFFYVSQSKRDLITKVFPEENFVALDLVLDQKLAEHLRNLYEIGIKVKWIDHHRGSLEISEDLLKYLKNNEILIWKDTKSTASLCCEYFNLKDSITKRICLIADRCDGDLSKRTSEVEKDSIVLKKLVWLGTSLNEIRKELVNYGSIESKNLQERVKVFDLLTVYSKKIFKENLIVDTKYFQVYDLTNLKHHLVGIRKIASQIASEEGKDVYTIYREKGEINLRGKTRLAREIFIQISDICRNSYWHGNVGGCTFPQEKLDDVLNFLEKLYKKEELDRNIKIVIDTLKI